MSGLITRGLGAEMKFSPTPKHREREFALLLCSLVSLSAATEIGWANPVSLSLSLSLSGNRDRGFDL